MTRSLGYHAALVTASIALLAGGMSTAAMAHDHGGQKTARASSTQRPGPVNGADQAVGSSLIQATGTSSSQASAASPGGDSGTAGPAAAKAEEQPARDAVRPARAEVAHPAAPARGSGAVSTASQRPVVTGAAIPAAATAPGVAAAPPAEQVLAVSTGPSAGQAATTPALAPVAASSTGTDLGRVYVLVAWLVVNAATILLLRRRRVARQAAGEFIPVTFGTHNFA